MRISRNAFNDSYTCVFEIDGTPVADFRAQFCKDLFQQRFLVPAGKHTLAIGITEESGNETWGSRKPVEVELQPGKLYTVHREAVDDRLVRFWLADENGGQVGPAGEWRWPGPRTPVADTYINGGFEPLTEKHRIFVFADFGERSRPFEAAFKRRFEELAGRCQIETRFLVDPHAVGLTLDPPHPPGKQEIRAAASAFGPDGVLSVKVTGWSGRALPTDAAAPLSSGRLTLSLGIAPTIDGADEWHARATQRISDDTGGDQLAQALVGRLSKQGAWPRCPADVQRDLAAMETPR